MEYDAIVVAAGSGSRSNLNYNKVLYLLDDKPIIYHSCLNFINDNECKNIIVVVKENEINEFKAIFKEFNKVIFVIGGATRQESVRNALVKVTSDYVLIHDGARPYFTNILLNRIKDSLNIYDSVIPVISVTNTIIEIKDNEVVKTLNRNVLRNVQTPQAFKSSLIKKAHQLALVNTYTDDSSMIMDLLNKKVYVVDGENNNIKFTNENDFRR